MENKSPDSIAERIRFVRKECGMSQGQLAELIGSSRPTIMALLATIASLVGCNNEIRALEKQQWRQLMDIQTVTLTADESRRLDELADRHLERLRFLRNIAEIQRAEAIDKQNGVRANITSQFIKLVDTFEAQYRIKQDG